MLNSLTQARCHEVYDFLASGSPPIFVRLLALNAFFLALYAVRKAAGTRPMPIGMAIFVQAIVVGANMLVLYQTEVESYVRQIIHP